MKKYLIFVIPLFIWGCSKTYNDVIDPVTANYQVTNVSSFADTTYKTGDSVFTFSITLSSSLGVNSLFFNVIDPNNNTLNNDPVTLYDDGKAVHGDLAANDNTFSNRFPFSQSYINGKYSIKYYIVDNNGATLAAIQNFNYNNNQIDSPPIISNLTAPDSATQQDTSYVNIYLNITVSDSNGSGDIQSVFYYSFKPDGTLANNGDPIFMFDDGHNDNNSEGNNDHGDAVAGDGIYSIIVQLPPKNAASVPKGTYRWEFQARDREGILSNKIIHNILIK